MTTSAHDDWIGVAIPISPKRAAPEQITLVEQACALWRSRKLSTYDIAKRLKMGECEVDRLVHQRGGEHG